jgi:hypothetical protein
MIARLKDWRAQLDAYLDGCDGKPFQWGAIDCALFAAGAVAAMTGADFAEPFHGKYVDEDGAKAAIEAAGFKTVADIAAYHFPEIAVGEAGVGDLASVEMPGYGPCLAIVGGPHIICMTLRGKGALPLTKANRAFRVG